MRHSVFVACLILTLGLTVPVQGQLRSDVLSEDATVRLYDQGQSGFSLNRFFSPANFRMSHSLEFSTSSFGGNSSSLGMYTNTMMWRFSQRLAARVDIAMAYSPYSDERLQGVTGSNNGRIFIRNAEFAYRPTKNSEIHLSFRQSPYGSYMSPYGYGYSGYGNRNYGFRGRSGGMFEARFGSNDKDLFWDDRNR
ncbi:MAG: hypothetical protein BMS9Abin05_2420 [Rhodothermia bacterium]|nr:MAG: hypothetical protein BMS9Abin05_2420 [Rhodothermia bacterium]